HAGDVRRLRPAGAGAGVHHEPSDRGGAYRDDPPYQAWRQDLDQHLPGSSADQEARRDPHGFGQGFAGVVDRERQARTRDVRDELPERGDRPRSPAPCGAQAPLQVPDRDKGGELLMATTQASELRELGEEELTTELREAKEELFNLRFQMATGQLDNNRRLRTVRRNIARISTVLGERELGLAVGPDEDGAA